MAQLYLKPMFFIAEFILDYVEAVQAEVCFFCWVFIYLISHVLIIQYNFLQFPALFISVMRFVLIPNYIDVVNDIFSF